jgi:adenine-specific DNA-methyltransferase
MGLKQSGQGFACSHRLSMMSLFHEAPRIEDMFHPQAQVVLYLGDVNDLLPTIPDETVKLIVTSPPYNIGKEYETKLEIEKYLDQQTKTIKELYRVLREDGSICWQVGNYVEHGEVFPLDIFYYQIFKSLGMRLRNRIIWHFGHGLHASKRFSGRYETILWFTKSDRYTFNLDAVRIPAKYPGKRHYKGPNRGQPSGNPLGKNPSDVWEIVAQEWEEGFWDIPNVKANHPEKTIHPAQYPIELAERCVLALTDEGDWVFDPYVGVGSTLIAALKQRRRAMGSEKEQKYVAIARERIRAYWQGVLPIRPIGKPIYTPTGREKVSQPPQEWQKSTVRGGKEEE